MFPKIFLTVICSVTLASLLWKPDFSNGSVHAATMMQPAIQPDPQPVPTPWDRLRCFLDRPYLWFEPGDPFPRVKASFSDADLSKLTDLPNGQSIRIACRVGGELMGSVMLENCGFVPASPQATESAPSSDEKAALSHTPEPHPAAYQRDETSIAAGFESDAQFSGSALAPISPPETALPVRIQ